MKTKIFVLLIGGILILSCTKNSEKNLLGKWSTEDQSMSCEFFPENKYSLSAENDLIAVKSVGNYEIKGDSLLLYDEKLNATSKEKPFMKTHLNFLDNTKIAFNSEVMIKE